MTDMAEKAVERNSLTFKNLSGNSDDNLDKLTKEIIKTIKS